MGMSASQARMLSLTTRMSDLEYSAQVISNDKIRLADTATAASQAYSDALDKQKLTVYSGIQNDGTASYLDANAYNLTTYGAVSTTDKQRFIKDNAGKVLVSTAVGKGYDDSQNSLSNSYYIKNVIPNGNGGFGYKNVNDFLKDSLGYSSEAEAQASGQTYDAKALTYYTNLFTGVEDFLNSQGYTSDTDEYQKTHVDSHGNFNGNPNIKEDSGATGHYTNIFNEIAANGYTAQNADTMQDPEWLQAQVTAGNLFLYTYDNKGGSKGTGSFVNVSWTSGDSSIQEKNDTADTAKAEAKYETTMADIHSKDNKFDLQLKEIDTEHTAIQTEIDSVKKVIDKNIQTSFKIFDA